MMVGYSQTDYGYMNRTTVQVIFSSATTGSIDTPRFGKPFNISYFINPQFQYAYKIILDFSGLEVQGTANLNLTLNMNLHEFT